MYYNQERKCTIIPSDLPKIPQTVILSLEAPENSSSKLKSKKKKKKGLHISNTEG